MLLFYRARGRFPRATAEVDDDAVADLARTLGMPAPLSGALLPEADRTAERQRAETRTCSASGKRHRLKDGQVRGLLVLVIA